MNFDEIFGDSSMVIERIDVDEDHEYKKHAMTLYERLNVIRDQSESNVVSEAISTHEDAGKIEVLTAKPQVPTTIEFNPTEIKYVTDISFRDENYTIPAPKPGFVTKWEKELKEYVAQLEEKISEMAEIDEQSLIIAKEAEKDLQLVDFKSGNTERRSVQMLALKAQYLERQIVKFSAKVASECRTIKAQLDPATDGLWVSKATVMTEGEMYQAPSVIIPIKRKLKFDARSMKLLMQICFSKRPEVRAMAKMDLNAKIDQRIMKDIFKHPEEMLTIAMAESQLSPAETIGVIFPTRERDHTEQHCICCETTVTVQHITYHERCAVVKWLEKYQSFKYDEENQAIMPIKRKLLTGTQKLRINEILSLHAKLSQDIVIKTASHTAVWARGEDGLLKKSVLKTVRPEDQIGTTAWKRANGFSK